MATPTGSQLMLRIFNPNGEILEYPLSHRAVSIGRSRQNDIVINHVSVELWHLLLEPEDGRWYLHDRRSDTGTYVDGRPVSADDPVRLKPGADIVFGEVKAQLMQPDFVELPEDEDNEGDTEAFTVDLESDGAAIAPGAVHAMSVLIRNLDDRHDDFTVELQRLPPEWVEYRPQKLSLAPGGHDEAVIVLRPPLSHEATHGEHEVDVVVTSSNHGKEEAVLAKIEILPYESLVMDINPGRRADEFTVTLHNSGNFPAEYALSSRTNNPALKVYPVVDKVTVPPGGRQSVKVMVEANAPVHEPQEFTVEAVPSHPGKTPQTAVATYHPLPATSRRRLIWPFVAVGCVVAAGILYYLFTR